MKFWTTLILGLGMAALACAQDGTPVNISQGPPRTPYQAIYGYTLSGSIYNLVYACYSPSNLAEGFRHETQIAISAATNANPVVFTSTGHGFNLNSRPSITIQGGTGNWAAVNGTFTATIIDANTFSIPVNSTAFGAVTGTLTFNTTAPRLNQLEWAVVLYAYDANNNLISRTWLDGSTGVGPSGFSARCSDATSTSTNIQ